MEAETVRLRSTALAAPNRAKLQTFLEEGSLVLEIYYKSRHFSKTTKSS
jgi:hypothetical protein